MKTPRKVIEKISLPLLFVTFVMAVLVFAVSPVSAQGGLCAAGNFCDRDGDGWIRAHKKCESPICDDTYIDCDDSNDRFPDENGNCEDDPIGGDIYTAELIIAYEYLDKTDAGASSGAFRFADGVGNLIDPIPVIIGRNPKDLGLGPLDEYEDVEMWRPNCGGWDPEGVVGTPGDFPTHKKDLNGNQTEDKIDGPGPWAGYLGYENCTYVEEYPGVPGTPWIPDWSGLAVDQATWDRMFAIGCPELEPKSHGKEPGFEHKPIGSYIDHIISTYGDWDFSEPGNYRLILRDIRLQDEHFVDWDVTIQLIASDVHEWTRSTGDWLPVDGGEPHLFFLTKGNMWGREVGGGPGGRQSCHKAPSGTDERMEGFFLWNPGTCIGEEAEACEHEATSVMEIVNPEGEYP